nr:MAG TPA: hypothetical protein [Caudoviricetes sp.]
MHHQFPGVFFAQSRPGQRHSRPAFCNCNAQVRLHAG